MDKLSQISLQNTVTVKIDYLLNQQLLVKNFGIIMDCLKDLKNQQDKHTSEINNLSGLRELFDKLKEEIRLKDEKEKETNNNEKNNNNNNNEKNEQNESNSKDHSIDQSALNNLQSEIEQLKTRMTKNQGSTHDNTSDINLLLKDMKDAKQDIENLKKQLQNINSSQTNNTKSGSQHSERNLNKNDNLGNEMLNNLNKQSKQHSDALQQSLKQFQDLKNHLKKLQKDLASLKDNQQNQQSLNDNNLNQLQNNNDDNSLQNMDAKSLGDILKRLQYLTKKTENIQGQVLNNTRGIHQLNESVEKNTHDIDGLKENVIMVEEELERVKKLLEQLERMKGTNRNNSNNNDNTDNSILMSEIQRLKEQYEKLLKLVNSLKNQKSSSQHSDNSNQTDRLPGSNKNIAKFSQDKSFRKRSESVDLNGKIRQLTQRIKILEKLIGEDNPERLPSIGWKKPNQTAYNGEKSHKKELAEMKNDLQLWIKSYLHNDAKNNGGNLIDLELKVQEIRNILLKKADHEGMKKGLAFLQGKITQLYMFLTEPQSEDAMIVRKGFNCLSCSKKVQTLRGKLGPRMNWDNLNNTHQNTHTPPKAGFPKYNDSNERDSM